MSSACNCAVGTCDSQGFLVRFDRDNDVFVYDSSAENYVGQAPAGRPLWELLCGAGLLSATEAEDLHRVCTHADRPLSCTYALRERGLHCFGVLPVPGTASVVVSVSPSESVPVRSRGSISRTSDELTGLLTRNAFCAELDELLHTCRTRTCAVFYFDIIKFKAINDMLGHKEGDRLLIHIADCLRIGSGRILAACRDSGDRFAFFADVTDESADTLIHRLLARIDRYDLPFEIACNTGVYMVSPADESGVAVLDKAMLALSSIKGSYTEKISYFTDTLRDAMLSEQEIVGNIGIALEQRQFAVYYQPQYNHSTGMIVGAEALVRWIHPEKGLISPGLFIPIFEKNGFITRLDLYIFEAVCRFLRASMDRNDTIVPISINFSKHDIFAPGFVESLESLRTTHNVPAKYLRIEITESVMIGNARTVNEILKRLHACGYIIEMDDFGSGYSSLNVLKDLDFDMIKLDMLFMQGQDDTGRGGTILSSIINMAKWLRIPVIAEGVETIEQADFLRSIGCDYIQGYLYSRPLPEADYRALLSGGQVGAIIPQMNLIDTMNAANFWSPESQETLIFSNFVGGAAIFNYDAQARTTEILRVNKKYLQELGMNLSERDIIHGNFDNTLDETNRDILYSTMDRAIATGEEQECETWRRIRSDCCGEDLICVRSTLRIIGQSGHQYLVYSMIRNVTAEKNLYNNMLDTERRFKYASEQVNIYFWEYTIATREMRPCFRCMRDLGLPPLLRDYPNSAIEAGIFPPEVADMYRDWHVQVANGVKELEAIIPLTPNRIPFRVRYTTEFDENGHPVKAYGSAALIVD